MGYIGNQTSNSYSSFDKQDLTGVTGSPAKRGFTLSHAVANAQEIEVFVNNVRQEPGEAYTASGTGLTMTGDVETTDDFYVVFQGKALQTVVPPDGSVTSAKLDTNIAVTGDLTVDTSTLHVDSTNNRVGIGTTSPVSSVHIVDTASTANVRLESGSGTPVILQNFASTSAGGAYIDVNSNHPLVFRTNAAERMRIDSSGNLMIGTTSFTPNPGVTFQTAAGNITLGNSAGSSGSEFATFRRSTVQIGSITQSGTTGVSYNTSSDYRLKENVTDITGATERLKQLNPVRFNFIADADTTVDGFLAHEVQDVVPEAITGTKDAVDDDGNPVYQGIDQSKLVPLLVATIQELEARISALEAN